MIASLLRARASVAAHADMRGRRADGKGQAYSSDELIPLAASALAAEGIMVIPTEVTHRTMDTRTGKGDVLVWVCDVVWTLAHAEGTMRAASSGAVLGSNTADAASGALTAAQRKLIEVLFGLRGQNESRIERVLEQAADPPQPTPPPAPHAKLAKAREAMEGIGRQDVCDMLDAASHTGRGVDAALAAARTALVESRQPQPAPPRKPTTKPSSSDDLI